MKNSEPNWPPPGIDWFYSDDYTAIVKGDCREILPQLPKVDLVLTDPPYGINHPCNFKQRNRSKLAECRDYPDVHGDNEPFDPSLWIKAPAILWGGNHYSSKLPDSSGWLVWDKERPDALDQATCELAWSNIIKGVRRFKYLWHGMMRAGDDVLVHPTQKPVALMNWCLSLPWTIRANTVLDPYFGSGSTLVAAKQLGRKAIGIEICEAYCEIAATRLRNEPNPLFTEPQQQPKEQELKW